MSETPRKPLFNAVAAEEYFTNLCIYYRDSRNQVFRKDNEGRSSENFCYSAEYQKLLGKEMALREVLEYFSKYDLNEWRPGTEDPREQGEYLACYHFPQNAMPTLHFYGVLDYYLTADPQPHWQHTLKENGPIIDWWMQIPHTPDETEEEAE